MNIICSPTGIIDVERPGQGVSDIERSGFKDVLFDISLACPPHKLERIGKESSKGNQERTKVFDNPSNLHNYLKPLLDHIENGQLHATIAYGPYLNRNSKHTDLNQLLFRLMEESIIACKAAQCRFIIIRPLFSGIDQKEEWAVNKEYYLRLASVASKQDVMILLENQCRDMNGHLIRGICSDGSVASEWVDQLNREVGEERFGFCVDVGVCNLCGQNMYDFVLSLGSRLKAVILRDCDGHKENAMLPFTSVDQGGSQTDWLNLIRGLREMGFDGHLIMSFADTAGSFSPLLRPELIQLARSVGNYFKWQIEIENHLKRYKSIVLFGAGNMCRNYMKCYGEKYPPLFTCDNNSAAWGTELCGLEVKSPDSLRELPKECGVFICNIYYREIEKQLKDMGVINIEFFNDEYMPSYYFDRLGNE